jgi:two-component system sensor histidine kinase/response regulator
MTLQENFKILVAEDNKINQRLIKLSFAQLGLSFDIASDGSEAFELFRQNKYDLILMDMHMPVMDGIESAKQIRKFEAISGIEKPVYIVALTASGLAENKQDCLEAGMNDFIEKPINNKVLLELIEQIKRDTSKTITD